MRPSPSCNNKVVEEDALLLRCYERAKLPIFHSDPHGRIGNNLDAGFPKIIQKPFAECLGIAIVRLILGEITAMSLRPQCGLPGFDSGSVEGLGM